MNIPCCGFVCVKAYPRHPEQPSPETEKLPQSLALKVPIKLGLLCCSVAMWHLIKGRETLKAIELQLKLAQGLASPDTRIVWGKTEGCQLLNVVRANSPGAGNKWVPA